MFDDATGLLGPGTTLRRPREGSSAHHDGGSLRPLPITVLLGANERSFGEKTIGTAIAVAANSTLYFEFDIEPSSGGSEILSSVGEIRVLEGQLHFTIAALAVGTVATLVGEGAIAFLAAVAGGAGAEEESFFPPRSSAAAAAAAGSLGIFKLISIQI